MMALYIALAAVILMLGAVLLWAKGAQRQQAQRSAQVLEQQLALRPAVQSSVRAQPSPQDAWLGAPKGWREFMLRTGIQPSQRFYLTLLLGIVVPPAVLLALVGPVAGAPCSSRRCWEPIPFCGSAAISVTAKSCRKFLTFWI